MIEKERKPKDMTKAADGKRPPEPPKGKDGKPLPPPDGKRMTHAGDQAKK